MIRTACLLLALGGCSRSDTPAWALDSIHLEPNETGDARGFQTWSLYADGWKRRPAARHYICSVIVTLDAMGSTPACSDCERGWTVAPTFLETDCAEPLGSDERFLSLQQLAIAPSSSDEAPHPEETHRGWADYGEGWMDHGWVYPAALDSGEPTDLPEPLEPLTFYPLYAWDY